MTTSLHSWEPWRQLQVSAARDSVTELSSCENLQRERTDEVQDPEGSLGYTDL